MPGISPQNYTFTKPVNESLEISLTYEAVAGQPGKFDCFLELANTHGAPHDHGTETNGSQKPAENTGPGSNGTQSSRGWLDSFWGSESARLVEQGPPEVPLLLGYIQMLGYVRLNHQIGAETGAESSLAVYWHNHEYASHYCSDDCDEKVQDLLHTELFDGRKQDTSSGPAKSSTIGGVPDLHARAFDPTAHYLLHDLVHPFGTMDMPPANAPPLSSHQQEELATSLSRYVAPIYVTAQHLIFASTTILPGQKCVYRFRMDMPPETLPPSYNTKLTGSLGDAGLASIAYLFVVGVQDQSDGHMHHRAVYFPMEWRPGHYGMDRSWLQHDYLQAPLFDKHWSPEKLLQGVSEVLNEEGESDVLNQDGESDVLNEDGESELYKEGAKNQSHDSEMNAEAGEGQKKNKAHIDDMSTEADDTKKAAGPGEEATNINGSKQGLLKTKSSMRDKFIEDLDSLIEGSLETLAAKERRKSSVCFVRPEDRGLLRQTPEKPRTSYQIRVNSQPLCVLTTSSAVYHVGEDVHFLLKLHPDFRNLLRIVGLTSHIEAHEIFHVKDERKIVNIYKVTPTIKRNVYADALMFPFAGHEARENARTGDYINLPRFLCQQFQASMFMDLRYFMVFRFVLNDFPEMESYRIDKDPEAFTEYVLAYKLENEANEFKFSIPLTVLPCMP
ncbi:Rgp1-domain-containing protein [Metschnikowia bicuspidata var. bicuspidata NRRL YB-4993]|uniref:Rgp1-domain-containing protein n=1 Tax=Metschnikowia bicuspidata var. bicuspidata NRRL YB-4993 TaxID=869754 RepID=A0A1A0HHG1_9ASCO|nr:Rgp1-domain-containing protein [Metschnikowia bicuspidata var. bicuspidata NRRL YB-4993]OBA23283.1 Rgp1-domain-containing protein [Metschnikowia bicuspidata var. bicuspidata NRRL YB-4993]